jgi:hypothetical protein
VWERRGVDIALKAVRSKTLRNIVGQSPKRRRTYLFAVDERDLDERRLELEPMLARGMERQQATTGLGLVASPRRVVWTFDALRQWVGRRKDADLPAERFRDADVMYADRGAV